MAWLEKLRMYKGDLEANPAVKLLGHFEKMCAKGGSLPGDGENKAGVKFELQKAQRESESLRTAPNLMRGGYIEKFVIAWMGKWKGERRDYIVENSG